jgi:hypothetical protein
MKRASLSSWCLPARHLMPPACFLVYLTSLLARWPHCRLARPSGPGAGYVLADMSVHQTRDYFLQKYGAITDKPEVGRELSETYWLVSRAKGEGCLAGQWHTTVLLV